MRNLLNKSVSFILALAIVLGFSAPAFTLNDVRAYQVQSVGNAETAQAENEAANIQALKEMFAAMTPGAIEIYESTLGGDKEQLDFYVEYIKPGFELKEVNARLANNPVSRIQVAITAMGLNLFIRAGFTGVASGVVEMAEGGFLVPEIAVTDSAFIAGSLSIIAFSWVAVEPHWDPIVNLFRKEFSAYDSYIVKLFDHLKHKASVYKAEEESTEEALDQAEVEEKKKPHINKPKHNWNKEIVAPVTWDKIRRLMKQAMLQGVETLENPNKNIYKRTLKLESGHKVVVKFIKLTETLWRIGTAWVDIKK